MGKKHLVDAVVYPIRMNRELKEKYSSFCEKNGLNMAGRIRLFMKKDMDKKVELEK